MEEAEAESDAGELRTLEKAAMNEAEGEAEDVVQKKKGPFGAVLLDEAFPRLSFNGGKVRQTRGRSVAILSALYSSHCFSAWGDRMWQFLVTLLLALLYPGSLLLPAVFGLVLAILPALLGTVLGDIVDRNPRFRVVLASLLVQNTLVCACAVCLAFLFGLDLGICGDVSLYIFLLLSTLTIILGATANLATVVNTISIEKDWVVVIADGNKNTLASLNANMRRIDLICKLLAPAVAGVILQFTGAFITTIVVAVWNIVSFFAELGLVWLVYHLVPALAVKKLRQPSNVSDALIEKEEEGDQEEGEKREKGDEDDDVIGEKVVEVKGRTTPTCCSRLLAPYISLRDGWGIYWRQEIALAGVAMATIYLTVLGFSGVTATYFLTQGLPNSFIGAAQGAGAVFGVTGTIAFPLIRRRVGTVRTGMFGISCQLAMLSLCVVGVFIPAERVSNEAEGYYSPHCTSNNDQLCDDFTTSVPLPSPSITIATLTPSLLTPSPSPTPTGSGSGDGDLNRPIRAADSESDVTQLTPTPSPVCNSTAPTQGSKVEWNLYRVLPIVLMLGGIILARFGLWIFDLAIQQRVQETVEEDKRGAVGGVMNAMNSVMDMMHYVLVIAAPRPEHFPVLTLISVAMVTLGALLYAIYLRRVRGHFFHCQKYWRLCQARVGGASGRSQGRYSVVEKEDDTVSSVVNEAVL